MVTAADVATLADPTSALAPALAAAEPASMTPLYVALAAMHVVLIVLSGILWAVIDVRPKAPVKRYLKLARGLHFGSLFAAPLILGLAFAFEELGVPAIHQIPFAVGIETLFAVGVTLNLYRVFAPKSELKTFFDWSRRSARVVTIGATAVMAGCMLWTAVAVVVYSVGSLVGA